MLQSTGLHVGIIMDGNGRWASRRGLPRASGHRAGATAVRKTIEAAPDLGIGMLTLYAFSSDNWKRPPAEVNALFGLLARYLDRETDRCVAQGVRIEFAGRRDRLPALLADRVAAAEAATRGARKLHVRIALDYSSRQAIVEAASRLRSFTIEALSAAIGIPDVDLVIRTSGEQRLSDFFLWECAYAELFFTNVLWPDFDERELARAVGEFHSRSRRFGAAEAVV